MATEFVPLHVHTEYSMLDGACRISDLASRANEWGMPAVAMTDHGNLCGYVEFYQTLTKAEVKPIVGCEFYVAPADHKDKRPGPKAKGYHLVLLAKDFEGYQNLCRLNRAAWLDGFYHNPRVDKTLLAEYSKGLIAMTACIGGEVPQAYLSTGSMQKASEAISAYQDIYGSENFFLELQNHGMEEELKSNKMLIELSKKHGLGLVATNDSHYLDQAHAEAHDVLLCIGTQSKLDEEKRMRFPNDQFYFKSPHEMAQLFAETPEALTNTMRIAEMCNVELEIGDTMVNHYPVFETPDDVPGEQFLRQKCLEAIPSRYGFDPSKKEFTDFEQSVLDRMNYELTIIERMGFVSYFLIVGDFIGYARSKGIPVGPGRGSGAGSLVAYLLEITNIEPLKYGLLFERFLNPDRVSPPDFDIDLCERRRPEVIEYVRDKYGDASVANIGTYGTFKAKAVFKDIARAMGQSFHEVNAITKLIPNDPKMTLDKALEESSELRELSEKEAWVAKALEYAKVLEGLKRHITVHACGVIIGDQPLTNLVPIGRGGSNQSAITQYSAVPCEDLGLLKMDFLGLRTLTVIQDALDFIKKNRGIELDPYNSNFDDPKAYELLNKGNTVAVFQLESGGFQDLCRRFGVNRLEDIIALIALYRPGPMQFLEEFIQRKLGEKTFTYELPELKPILEETYGIMLYQEQVMQVVQEVAGFSLGQADILRRAMGKKKIKVMEEQYEKFVEGAGEKGVSKEVAEKLWEKIQEFAKYGFNKSHSAAYGVPAYITAYLKANYPVELMAAVLASEIMNQDKLAFLLKECDELDIDVRPPSVNTSDMNFSVDGDTICFGLGAIKGVGSNAAEEVIAAREGKPFEDLQDFCERTETKVNRKAMESLCKAGAFDCFGWKRSQVFAAIPEAISRAQEAIKDKQVGQTSLFDFMDMGDDAGIKMQIPDVPEWPERELLAYEKELLGFYVTGHPLGEFSELIRIFETKSVGELKMANEEIATRTGGILSSIEMKRRKKDDRAWAVVSLEGLDGAMECLVFPDCYDKHADVLVPEAPVFVEGRLSMRDEENPSFVAENILPLESAPQTLTKEVHIRIYEASVNQEKLAALKELCARHAGEAELIMCIVSHDGDIAFAKCAGGICNSVAFRQEIFDLLGENALVQKAKPCQVETPRQRRWQGPPVPAAAG